MADVMKTCTNCGNSQATGDFCEKCGTRMPDAAEGAAPAPSAGYQAPPVPGAAPGAAPGAYQPGAYQPGAYQPGATPPYGYGAQQQYAYPREPGPWSKLFDLSFQGFATPALLRVLFFVFMGLIGVFVLLSIIYGALMGARFGVLYILIALITAAVWFFWTRLLFELMTTARRQQESAEKEPKSES